MRLTKLRYAPAYLRIGSYIINYRNVHYVEVKAVLSETDTMIVKGSIFSSPGRSPGRAIVLPSAAASALASASALAKC